MGLSRTLLRFTFLSAICHQVTYTLVEGSIFEDARRRSAEVNPRLGDLVRCHLCTGTWVGLLLAAAYQPRLLSDVQQRRPSLTRRTLDLLGDAFLLALGGRVWNEGLGLLRNEVRVKEKTAEGAAAESESRAIIEPGRSAFPGISVR
jgi:hypothetical protein